MRIKKDSKLTKQMMEYVVKDHLELKRGYKKMLLENIRLKNELEVELSVRKNAEDEVIRLRNELFESQETISKLRLIQERTLTVEEMDGEIDREYSEDEEMAAYWKAYNTGNWNPDEEDTYENEDLNKAI